MREQLIQYVNLLFAGAPDCDDMKQEILQNTLDRYDDLITEGKVPEAAYRLAIAGIGDINEILGTSPTSSPVYRRAITPEPEAQDENKKKMRATAIGLYILCPIPLFIASEFGLPTLGLCGLLAFVAVATAMIIVSSKNEKPEEPARELTEQEIKQKSIKTAINTAGLVVYFLLSFLTRRWTITWLVFPITAAVWELTKAIWDLKEATNK